MNTKKLKKTQILLVYSLFGGICGVSFIVLLLSNHLNNIRMNFVLKDLNSHSNYTLTFKEAKHCNNQKYTLFSWGEYNFSGYCLKEAYLSYNNLTFPLKEILKKNYLQVEDLFKNTSLQEENNYIRKYVNQKEEYTMIVSEPIKNYKEVIFSKES